MKPETRASIVCIVSRLIAGKRVATIYDFTEFRHVSIASLPDAGCLKEFDEAHRDYYPGYATDCKYHYKCSTTGVCIDVSINNDSFMGHVSGSAAYFAGNMRGDLVTVFDHEEAAHFNYRISGCMVERDDSDSICSNCWYMK